MAKDPAFLFYPGDYLRDTQNLSEKTQVAYDRIMCEHMRNICISKQQLKFFTKRLSDEEKEELNFMLIEINGGYQIEWVAESITKRKAYSESRRNNRTSKPKQSKKKTSTTYDTHMENEDENVNDNKREKVIFPFDSEKFKLMWDYWKEYKKKEKNFRYKSHISEQAALKKLSEMADGNQDVAMKIIEESIAQGWTGFFDLKSDNKINTASIQDDIEYFRQQKEKGAYQ